MIWNVDSTNYRSNKIVSLVWWFKGADAVCFIVSLYRENYQIQRFCGNAISIPSVIKISDGISNQEFEKSEHSHFWKFYLVINSVYESNRN